MKPKISLALTIGALMAAIGLATSPGNAGVTGSPHDFGAQSWSTGKTCQPCHTPHDAVVEDANGDKVSAPLWSHTLSTATYYLTDDWSDPSATPQTGEVDQNSKVCLSCHDGTVALDSFGGATGSTPNTNSNLGTDLSDDHPIGDAARWWTTTPSYMVDPSFRTTAGIMPLRKMADGSLAVGCTTCHEPHNRKSTTHMLWVNNSVAGTTVDGRAVNGSLLCMNCHKK